MGRIFGDLKPLTSFPWKRSRFFFVSQLVISPEGSYAALVEEIDPLQKELIILDLVRGRTIQTYESDSVVDMAFSPKGDTLVVNHGDHATIWTAPSGRMDTFRLPAMEKITGRLCFHPDDEVCAARTNEGNAIIFDVHSGKTKSYMPINEELLGFSKDGNWLYSAFRSSERFIKVRKWKWRDETWGDAADAVLQVKTSWSAFDASLAFGGDRMVLREVDDLEMWDLTTKQRLWIFLGPIARSVDTSPDGMSLMIESPDETLRLRSSDGLEQGLPILAETTKDASGVDTPVRCLTNSRFAYMNARGSLRVCTYKL